MNSINNTDTRKYLVFFYLFILYIKNYAYLWIFLHICDILFMLNSYNLLKEFTYIYNKQQNNYLRRNTYEH